MQEIFWHWRRVSSFNIFWKVLFHVVRFVFLFPCWDCRSCKKVEIEREFHVKEFFTLLLKNQPMSCRRSCTWYQNKTERQSKIVTLYFERAIFTLWVSKQKNENKVLAKFGSCQIYVIYRQYPVICSTFFSSARINCVRFLNDLFL